MKYNFNAFYQELIPVEPVTAVLSGCLPEERQQALDYLQLIMNYTVWQLVCQLLQPEDMSTFFSLQTSNFTDQSLLAWLQERNPEITMLLPEVLERSLIAVAAELENI